MVSGESETFVSRVRRVGTRATRGDAAIGRRRSAGVQSDGWFREGGARAPGETGADALPCAGRRDARRARSTRSSPWSWCVRFARRSSSYGAAADEAGELGPRAPTSNSKRAFVLCPHVLSSQERATRTCRTMPNRQRFCAAPIGRGRWREFISNDGPQRRAVIAPVIDTIINRADWRRPHDCSCSHVVRFRPHPGGPTFALARFNRDGRTARPIIAQAPADIASRLTWQQRWPRRRCVARSSSRAAVIVVEG